MRKYGKYEKRPEGAAEKQPEVKSPVLQTYFTSLIGLVLCVTMFFGTTYAWFTGEVTNTGNEIYIGTLDVDLQDAEGNSLNGSAKPLFDSSIRWEPGYTALRTIKIVNEGNLAFRYVLSFTDGAATDSDGQNILRTLAENFVVYVHKGDYAEGEEAPKSFADIKANAEQENESARTWKIVQIGNEPATLADILEKELPVLSGNMEDVRTDAADTTASTGVGPSDSKPTEETYIIALHMLESAGQDENGEDSSEESKKLMGKKISLNVKLTAYQRTHEEDAFDASYDLKAHVTNLGKLDIEYTTGIGGKAETMTLDSAYQFQPVESYEEAKDAPYRCYIADFAVWADQDINRNSIALAGYYSLFCDGFNDGKWVALVDDSEGTFATEEVNEKTPIRLVQPLYPVTYELLCQYGNDGIGFLCGLAERNNGVPAGTVVTVELRLYEVAETSPGSGDYEETGEYIVAGRYEYTFK